MKSNVGMQHFSEHQQTAFSSSFSIAKASQLAGNSFTSSSGPAQFVTSNASLSELTAPNRGDEALAASHQLPGPSAEAPLDPYCMVPTLSPHMHDAFGGPHTQFACGCFYVHPTNGSLMPCQLVMSCTQLFLCDAESFVIRVCLINRLLAVYHRDVGGSALGGSARGANSAGSQAGEQELLLVFDREHDVLLRGTLVCDGVPAKPFLPTLQALQKIHCPTAPLALHLSSPVPLKDIAKLKPLSNYVAPIPQREETWDQCPCWRSADVLNISDDEFATRIRNLCIVHCPEKLPTVPDICRKYNRRKGGILQHMIQQYGPEPTEEHAMTVLKVLQREEKFASILKGSAQLLPQRGARGTMVSTATWGLTGGIGSGVSLSTFMKANKQLTKSSQATAPLIPEGNPLWYPLLTLVNQPSGGHGRIHIRVKPTPFLPLQQDPFTKFARRPHDTEHEFWFLTNEGYVTSFDISPEVMLPFGYSHGDRVMATWGVTRGRWSTIVGVRDGTLWVMDDGDYGATALIGFSSRDELERCNGWIKQDRMSMPLKETSSLEVLTMPDMLPRTLHIAPEVTFPRFGFYHGEVVQCADPHCDIPFDGVAVIAGVDAEDGHTLYAFFVDPSDEGLTQELLLSQQLLQLRRQQQQPTYGVNSASPFTPAPPVAGVSPVAPAVDGDINGTPQSSLSLLRVLSPVGPSKRITPSRVAAQPLIRCMTPRDVQIAYGWRSIGAARVLQHNSAADSQLRSASIAKPPSVIL